MSIFRDFFVKQKPVFTGITRGVGGFGFGKAAGGGEEGFLLVAEVLIPLDQNLAMDMSIIHLLVQEL